MSPAVASDRPRILYIDAYDSFSNNIIALVKRCVDADVDACYIDSNPISIGRANPGGDLRSYEASDDDLTAIFLDRLKEFDAVIAGPGPGWVTCDKDVGLMKALWTLRDAELLPVLGICLGFQSMCVAFGASIQKLQEPRHGLVSSILHNGRSIFSGVEQLLATQYHSWEVNIGHFIQTKKAVRYPSELWVPTESCPELEPLAWDFDNKRNGAVLMAAKHTSKPFWGVQFHPESICTNDEGRRLIQNWWHDVQLWGRKRSRGPALDKGTLPTFRSGSVSVAEVCGLLTSPETIPLDSLSNGNPLLNTPHIAVHCATTGSGRLTVSDVVELFDLPRNEAIVLESGLEPDLLPIMAGTGRHSILGLIIPGETYRIHYYAGSKMMQLRDGKDKVHREWQEPDPWRWIRNLMMQLQQMAHPPTTPTWAPFWGGLMGYASYEAGLETIGVNLEARAAYPDICFAYITRSIVLDHQLKKIYVQSIRGENDRSWVRESLEKIYDAVGRKSQESTPNPTPMPKPNPFERDTTLDTYLSSCHKIVADRDEYCASINSCHSSIANGLSYELCLTNTNQVRARRPRACRLSRSENNELSWKLYKRLTSQNPAPFSAYLRVHNVHVLSSSPERYISWDRSQKAQCRPIKGTVAKKPYLTSEDAHAILSSPKERAENLMIVDLVRHQLHGVYGADNVRMQKLMEVEEYETVWQLVSVIDATPPGSDKPSTPDQWEDPIDYVSKRPRVPESSHGYLGFEAFVQSLPPGSMTGAPKKRSCELLLQEEAHQRRGIYSGVLGYLDIGGAGDFSVVIRTAVKTDDAAATEDTWCIGAGGAITAQSEPDAEYDEMLAKFQSTAATFAPLEQRLPGGFKSAAMRRDVMQEAQAVLRAEEEEEENDEALLETLESLQAQLMMLQRENERRRRSFWDM